MHTHAHAHAHVQFTVAAWLSPAYRPHHGCASTASGSSCAWLMVIDRTNVYGQQYTRRYTHTQLRRLLHSMTRFF
jgi:hypothetical protein